MGEQSSRTSSGIAASFSPRLLLLLIVSLILLYGVIYPNLHVVLLSLQRDGIWSLQNYREILAQRKMTTEDVLKEAMGSDERAAKEREYRATFLMMVERGSKFL